MKQGKWVVSVFTVLLILAAFVIGKCDLANRNFPFSVKVTADGRERIISCFESSGEYYVVLPAYVRQEQVTICTNPIYDIYIGDQLLTEEMSCVPFPLNKKLDLFYYTPGGEPDGTVTFLQSENVGTVYIDVPSGNMDYIHTKKGNEEGGYIQVYDADGTLWHTGYLESIRGRGNWTWTFEKKPYSITTGNPADLLGMGAGKEWILLSNAADPSHLRNKIAYDLAAEVGLPYSPECRWVDLYLNGEYAGLYLLSERNEIHPQRVAIGSGNFLVSMELEGRLIDKNQPYIKTTRGTALRIHQSDLPHASIQQIWESAENAIFSEDGIDPNSGKHWTDLIDLDSWAKKYLMEELMGNYDAGSISQYFYYDNASGKIFAGPIWDMDNTLGISERVGAPNAILAGRAHMWAEDDSPFYYTLLEQEVFLKTVIELYRTIYQPALEELCGTKLEIYANHISTTAKLDQIRWLYIPADAATEEIKAFLLSRQSFLEQYLESRDNFVTVHLSLPGTIWYCWALSPGEVFDSVSIFQEYEWYDLETEEYFDLSTPIYQNTILQAKFVSETESETP